MALKEQAGGGEEEEEEENGILRDQGASRASNSQFASGSKGVGLENRRLEILVRP